MEEKQLTEKESIELISQMIRNSQQKLESSDGRPFLVYGYLTVLISSTIYYLISSTGNYMFHWLWFLLPVLGTTTLALTKGKESQEQFVKTYIDRIINSIWTVIGAAALMTGVGAFIVQLPVLQIIVLLMAIGTTLTGAAIKYKLLIISGILGMASPVLLFLVGGLEQILAFGAIFLVMMVIPGHILRYQNRKGNV
jgi:hypothetical protein